MRAEHVVVGRDDADVGRLLPCDPLLLNRGRGRHRVREVAARRARARRTVAGRGVDALEVGGSLRTAALDDALGNSRDGRVHGYGAQ